MRTLLLITLVACAHAAPSQPPSAAPSSPAAAQPCPAADAAVPPEDAALARWKAIMADEYRPPAGTAAAALVPELVAYLGSPDPVRRDGVAYEVFERWIGKGVLTDDEARGLAVRLIANLRGPLEGADGVFLRSFSALVLAVVVARDGKTPFLQDAERREILAASRDYAHRETDLRGHTGARGWAHAAAHTADLLAQLAKLPSFTDDDRAVMLDAVAGLVVRGHGHVLHHGEDGRLAVAVLGAARRGIAQPALVAWLEALKAPLVARGGPAFDAGRYAAQRNARNLLFTLFVQVSMMPSPSDGERRLLDAIRALLGP